MVARLQTILRIPTVSLSDETAVDWDQFERFINTLQTLYPRTHTRLQRERIGGHSLLFRWPGRSESEPSVLMAHYDVVPATDFGWKHPPFAGELSGKNGEQVIWGRGALDNKGSLAAILEAVESQLEDGVVPAQDIFLVFGHNEETTGSGASAICDALRERGIRPALVLDEGGAIVTDVFPGLAVPVAVVGVAEKGSAIVRLVVDQQGGHASTPPAITATVRLAMAIVRLNNRPFRGRLDDTAREMFRTIGVHATGMAGWAYRHIGLTRWALVPILSRSSPELRAMVRTTQAVTGLDAGQAQNALAERATATVNVRIAVGGTIEEVLERMVRVIRDEAVRVELVSAEGASPVSPITGLSWEVLRSSIENTFPGTVVTPYVQNGASDARHFTRISSAVYRFSAFTMTTEERESLHARNEHIHVSSWLRGVDFYRALIAAL